MEQYHVDPSKQYLYQQTPIIFILLLGLVCLSNILSDWKVLMKFRHIISLYLLNQQKIINMQSQSQFIIFFDLPFETTHYNIQILMLIDQLSQKLLKNEYFINEMKNAFQKFYQQKKVISQQEQKSIRNFNGQAIQINEIRDIQQDQDLHIKASRYSISSSVFSKRQSRGSISSMASNSIYQQFMQPQIAFVNLNQITNEIASTLFQIVKNQCLLNAKSTSTSHQPQFNISEVIERVQSLQKQQIKTLMVDFQQKILILKNQIQEQVISIIKKIKLQRKHDKNKSKLTAMKQQRKKVTQSILNISKIKNQMSTFSNIQEIGSILSDSEQQDYFRQVKSPQLSQHSQIMESVCKFQSKISKQLQQRVTKQVQQNRKDIDTLTQRIVEWKLKGQQRLENGFSGVWNIMADIQDKINKLYLRLEQVQHAYTIKN